MSRTNTSWLILQVNLFNGPVCDATPNMVVDEEVVANATVFPRSYPSIHFGLVRFSMAHGDLLFYQRQRRKKYTWEEWLSLGHCLDQLHFLWIPPWCCLFVQEITSVGLLRIVNQYCNWFITYLDLVRVFLGAIVRFIDFCFCIAMDSASDSRWWTVYGRLVVLREHKILARSLETSLTSITPPASF